MLSALLGYPGVRGECFVDQAFGDGRVFRNERRVAPVRRRREPRAGRGIDEMMGGASPAAARLADEPTEPRIDVRRAVAIAGAAAADARVENEPIAEMPQKPQARRREGR